MVKCEYEGTGVWEGKCIGTKEVDPCLGYDKCKQYRPIYTTNADRIRAMAISDEELAAAISRSSNLDLCDIVCSRGCKAVATFNKTSQQRCAEIVLDWLQQPAE